MSDENTIREALPPAAVGRVSQILLKNQAATLVVDASGLGRREAEALSKPSANGFRRSKGCPRSAWR